MPKHLPPFTNFPLPTASGVGSDIAYEQTEQRNTAPTNRPSHDQHVEMIARGMAESQNCYIDHSIIGLSVRSLKDREVIAKGFPGFQSIIDAYERGEISKAVQE